MKCPARLTGCGSVALLLAAGLASAAAPAALEQELQEACRRLRPAMLRGTSEDVLGEDGWVVVVSELRYVAGGPFWGNDAPAANPHTGLMGCDPIPAIVDFARQLQARGIRLVFMPVPTRVVIYPESVLGRAHLAGLARVPHLNSAEAEFYRILRGQGVEVLDLTATFLEHRSGEHGTLFVPSETHWTPYAVSLAAQQLGETLRKEPWYATVPKGRYATEWVKQAWTGHVYKDLVNRARLPARPPDEVWLRTVRRETPAGPVRLARRNPASPVLVLGDSNSVFWFDQDAALPQQLAAELGFDVDSLSTTGGGSTNTRVNLARAAQADPGYLAGKKVVVWCLASRTFRDSSWWVIPLDRAPAGKTAQE